MSEVYQKSVIRIQPTLSACDIMCACCVSSHETASQAQQTSVNLSILCFVELENSVVMRLVGLMYPLGLSDEMPGCWELEEAAMDSSEMLGRG